MTESTSETKDLPAADDEAPEARAYVREDSPSGHGKGRTPDSSYQNYLFGSAGSGDAPAWSDSAKGRAAIRVISRGIVGSLFFAMGGRMATKQLHGYHKDHWKWDSSKPLQAIAKGIDSTLGAGIEKTVKTMAGLGYSPEKAAEIAKDAVTFRDSRMYEYMVDGVTKKMAGRSYGSDIVGFTFDFAMASVGDASTRNIIQTFDPNVKKSWLLNERGEPAAKGEKTHIDWAQWAKATASSSWRVFSKNQGEDWAAAVPYAFQMKFQRQFLRNVFNKHMDGHHLVFDHSWNGGAYRVNQKNQIVGDYQLAGAIDLHARFVGYNWYTLMFREGYDSISNTWNKWKDEGFAIKPHLPEHFNPITAPIDMVGQSIRYATKSFIKANMYMNPAVIPFWMVRVPQSKWRSGQFIRDEDRSSLTVRRTFTIDTQGPTDIANNRLNPFGSETYYDNHTATRMDRFSKGFSQTLNPIGQASYWIGEKGANLSDKVAAHGFWPTKGGLGGIFKSCNSGATAAEIRGDRRKFMHEYIDASLSYTPYMYAKQEFGLRVDDSKGDGKLGEMDKAIYSFMDNIAAFKFRQAGTSLKHMWTLGTNFEREIKAREGGDISTQEIAKQSEMKPGSTVHASTVVRHDPASLSRGEEAANDAQMKPEDRWTHMVAGSDIAQRLHPESQTRH